MLLEITNIS